MVRVVWIKNPESKQLPQMSLYPAQHSCSPCPTPQVRPMLLGVANVRGQDVCSGPKAHMAAALSLGGGTTGEDHLAAPR